MIDLQERVVEKKSFFNRLIVIYLFFGLIFIFFLERTYSLQISDFRDYENAAIETKEKVVQTVRGIIYDRKGTMIVKNVPSYEHIIKPWEIPKLNKFIKEISISVEQEKKEIENVEENFTQRSKYNRELILKKNLTKVEIARFEVRSYKFPNAFIDERYSRKNNYPHLFSHAIGYVGGISNEQLSYIF